MDVARVIQNSYRPDRNAFAKEGYVYQSSFSQGNNHQAYYNPTTNQLLFSVAGTHNLSDVGTDVLLGAGVGFKESSRYRAAQSALQSARAALNPSHVSVYGHSLGGTIARGISSPGDTLFTYNSGETFGARARPFEQAYRTEGDLVSLLGAGHDTTLMDRNNQSWLGFVGNSLNAHSSQNLVRERFRV